MSENFTSLLRSRRGMPTICRNARIQQGRFSFFTVNGRSFFFSVSIGSPDATSPRLISTNGKEEEEISHRSINSSLASPKTNENDTANDPLDRFIYGHIEIKNTFLLCRMSITFHHNSTDGCPNKVISTNSHLTHINRERVGGKS